MTSEHGHTIRSVSLGTVWRACRYPFVVLSAVVIPKLMGDKIYGDYALFMTVYLLLDVITDVGVTQTFGRFIPELKAKSDDKVSELLHSMLFYGVIITLLVIIFGEGGIYLFGEAEYDLSLWMLLALLLIVTKVEGSLFAFIYGCNDIARYSLKELIRSAATFVLVALGFIWFGLRGALWALLASELCLLAAAFFWSRRSLLTHIRIMPPRHFLEYLSFGARFYVPMMLFSFLQRSGNVFVKRLTGSSEEVAYFDISNQYLLLTATYLGMIITTLLPSATAMHLRDEHDRIVEWHSRVMGWCGIVIVLTVNALALVGQDILALVLGNEFAPVYPSAMVISIALPAVLVGYAGTNFALLEKSMRAYLAGVIAGLAVMALVCMLLVPSMGAVGAAWGSVAGYSVLALVFIIRYMSEFSRILAGLFKTLPAVLICVPFWYVRGGLILSGTLVVVSSLLYLGFVWRIGVVSSRDIRELMDNFGKRSKKDRV
jgi:O-antigen/teichoic acid export membrane protein